MDMSVFYFYFIFLDIKYHSWCSRLLRAGVGDGMCTIKANKHNNNHEAMTTHERKGRFDAQYSLVVSTPA
jgi:hypothetical protein